MVCLAARLWHTYAQSSRTHRYCDVKIIVDENMPYATALFSRLGEVKAVPGRPLPEGVLDDADALMVRSVTKVNADLLAGKPVKFVGTATAGTDHVDVNWLDQAGLQFSAAPGCNAIAVVEYVFSALLMLAERDGFSLQDRTHRTNIFDYLIDHGIPDTGSLLVSFLHHLVNGIRVGCSKITA